MGIEEIVVILASFLIGLWNAGLAVYVYKKNPEKETNKTFAWLIFLLSLFSFNNALIWAAKDILWLKTSYALISLVPVLGMFFISALIKRKFNKIIKYGFIGWGVLLSVLSYTPLLIKKIEEGVFGPRGIHADFGEAFPLWGLYALVGSVFFLYVLVKAFLNSEGRRKSAIAYFIGGAFVFIAISVISNAILPLFGISGFAFLGALSSVFISVPSSYAIVRYQMMGIERKVFRVFFYSLGIALLTGLVGVIIFLGSWLLNYVGTFWVWLSSIVVALIVVWIARAYFQKSQALQEAKEHLEERVRAQTKELRELNEELEQRVEERTRKLRESRDELQEKIEELEKFHESTEQRDLKMIELKKRVDKLKEKIKKAQGETSS